jgi:polyphosphate kinase
VTPVDNRHLRERLWEVLQVQLADERNAWIMQPDGTYERCTASNRSPKVARDGSHAALMKRTRQRARH